MSHPQGETKQATCSANIGLSMSKLKISKDGKTNSSLSDSEVPTTIHTTIHPLLLNFAARGGFSKSNEVLMLFEKNHICSSLGIPFLVISKAKFVHGHPPLTNTEEYDKFITIVLSCIMSHDSEGSEEENILSDFEGEMPGFGGDLSCAQFLPTHAIENGTLRDKCVYPTCNTPKLCSPYTAGLLVDLRDSSGIMITQSIMNTDTFTKLIWGATGDLTSLRYQNNLGTIMSKNVVDVQLGFSSPGRLLGMGKAVESLPYAFKKGLPNKDQGHDWSPRAMNRRCVPLPLSQSFAKYAMDDLHRIDAILSYRKPSARSYKSALDATTRFLTELENPQGAIQQVLNEMRYFERKYGMQKRIKAVEINRVLVHIQIAFKGRLSSSQSQQVDRALQRVSRSVSVTIPKDLSWN
jgi:hypothetical protein